jgi:uncharacterized membrane protein
MDTLEAGERQLRRLERLMDVVFALVIWRIFLTLPRPAEDGAQWASLTHMLASEWQRFVLPVIAILIVVVYWLQNNALFSKLKATDAVHTGISVFQVFFLLLFLYSIGAGLQFEAAADARVFESGTTALVGITAYLGWWYAWRRGRLLAAGMAQADAAAVARRNLAEPLTALLTVPFAFVGPTAWELSWLLYPLIQRLFTRFPRRRPT